jgi:hypothetical protein
MRVGEEHAGSGVVRRFVLGALPILTVCALLWILAAESSPGPAAITSIFVVCAIILWFGWSSIRRNTATRWLAFPLIALVGVVLGGWVLGIAIGVAAWLGAALCLALPYLIYDLLFRAPLEGQKSRSPGDRSS